MCIKGTLVREIMSACLPDYLSAYFNLRTTGQMLIKFDMNFMVLGITPRLYLLNVV
jgi:hypothetical protein